MKTKEQIEEMAGNYKPENYYECLDRDDLEFVENENGEQFVSLEEVRRAVYCEAEKAFIKGATLIQQDLINEASEGHTEWRNYPSVISMFPIPEESQDIFNEVTLPAWQAAKLSAFKEVTRQLEKIAELEAFKKEALEVIGLVLNNYEICTQNPHNDSTIAHKYLNTLRTFLAKHSEKDR